LASQEYTILDWRVLAFAVGIAGLTGLLFGVFPAYLSSRLQPSGDVVRSSSRGSGASQLRRLLVAMQVSLTVMLLVGSVVLGRSFLGLLGTDLGFHTDRLVTLNVSLLGTRYKTPAAEQQYFDEALSRLRAIPGVESVGGVEYLPLGNFASTPKIGDHYKLDSGQDLLVIPIKAMPDYFRTLGIEMIYGREFTAADRIGSEPVAIVNEEFARNFGVPSAAIGRKVTSALMKTTVTIVGVARSVRYAGPPYGSFSQIFLAEAQTPRDFATFVARVRGRPANYLPVLRDVVQSIDREVAAFGVQTLDDRLAEMLARPRLYTTAIAFLGGFALLLAIIGIYGVASYTVTQRAHEIGVRIAVGATTQGVRLLILRDSLLPVALGLAAGAAGALGLGQFLQHLIEKTQPVDFVTCAASGLILTATAAAATWTATHRVVRMDPIVVLRAE
jgi:predicted permease